MIEGENFVLGSTEAETEHNDAGPEIRRGPGGTAMQPDVQRNQAELKPAQDEHVALLEPDQTQALRSKWDQIQTGFVDEPRRAVKDADTLVAETIDQLSETFSQARARMEQEWDRGDSVSTEDLRMALRRYRSFFTRLLAM